MDHPPYWQHSIEKHNGQCIVTLTGEIDTAAAPDVQKLLLEQLLAPQVTGVDVDLAAATFIDSAMLTALITGYRVAEDNGCAFAVVNPSGTVRRILAITGLLELMVRDAPEPSPR